MVQRQSNASYFSSIPKPGTVPKNPPSQNSLSISIDERLIPKIQGYLRTAEALQKVATGTSELVSQYIPPQKNNSRGRTN
jgi:hypothetical protein